MVVHDEVGVRADNSNNNETMSKLSCTMCGGTDYPSPTSTCPLCFGLPKCDNCGHEFDQDMLGKYGCPNCENDKDHDIGDDPNYP
jgi:predicted Zn-ribbon and HTH transcriptional regulator